MQKLHIVLRGMETLLNYSRKKYKKIITALKTETEIVN